MTPLLISPPAQGALGSVAGFTGAPPRRIFNPVQQDAVTFLQTAAESSRPPHPNLPTSETKRIVFSITTWRRRNYYRVG